MTPRTWRVVTACFSFALLAAIGACFQAPIDPQDCLAAGTCECLDATQCPEGKDCIDGRCQTLVLDAGPTEGELGAPCTANAQCNSGICLPPGPGRTGVCTEACGDGGACPGNWECKTTGSDAGHALLCVPPYNALCLPCETDGDCNAIGDRCLRLPEGGFCGRDCTLSPCPSGYSCQESPGADGGVAARQCVPDSNSCQCSDVNVGLGRGCRSQNTFGTCYGFSLCQANGTWADCDAPSPSAEVCNGQDDDCDGLLDHNDPTVDTSTLPTNLPYPACQSGSSALCVGTWTCADADGGGFGWTCGARPVEDEQCNGFDENCNGSVDETFRNDGGQYADVNHCGACGYDCETAISNLRPGADGGVAQAAVACELRNSAPTCVPKQCAPGFSPYPPNAPVMCLQAQGSSCRSCAEDADCGPFGDQCVALAADVGTFCAQRCDSAAPYVGCTGQTGVQGCCPSGYTCEARGTSSLCIPQGESCTCKPSRVGATRSCVVQSGAATCFGEATCNQSAPMSFEWGVCDTGGTTVELCDGQDNNCDGEVDEPFINTRDAGTYDTDQHCGSCTMNCTAQWNPTIQHAIGGCVAGPTTSPTCEIVRCTQERVPGGKLCQIDADCGPASVCHPLYRQCIRTCGSNADCGGGTCVSGTCTAACTSTADCTQRFGAGSSCNMGTCEVVHQFVNADEEPTNGCECPSAQGVVDVPDLYASYPDAGMPYVDRNCDGVDGEAAKALFVRAGANGNGTRTSPFGSISQAIAAYNPQVHTAILVAAGSYVEQVQLRNRVHLYGGYASDFLRRDVVAFPTLIEGPEPNFNSANARHGAVNAENITARTVIAGFTIRGYDVTWRPPPGAPAKSSYAIYVRNSNASLVIANNHVVGGRGGDAAQAAAGSAGQNGGKGLDGLDSKECTTPSCSGESQPGGTAGTNAACGAANGNPGATSRGNANPQAYQPPLGKNGQGGANGEYRHSDPSQSNLCKYDCVLAQGGLNGQPAQNGTSGSAPGGGGGCASASGSIVGGEWVAGAGQNGGSGTPGSGGGGGGAGGVVTNSNPPGCTVGNRVGDLGGTGGGGGAGGCGGGAGLGGGSGGGSFGVFLVFNGPPAGLPAIEGNIIEIGSGGNGGSGGPGGYGGLGGPGGEGGVAKLPAWCAGQGGNGGRGGNGGAGSGGGGGCGGSAHGIAGNRLAGNTYASTNIIPTPAPSQVGNPGAGGASPAGASNAGSAGQPGVLGLVTNF